MEQWRQYCQKFLTITKREQYLISLTGIVVIVLLAFNLSLDGGMQEQQRLSKKIKELTNKEKNNNQMIELLSSTLKEDVNQEVKGKIEQTKKRLSVTDEELLSLTSELIDPVQMRYALIDLLKMQQGVSLVSLQVLPAVPLVTSVANSKQNEESPKTENIGLFKHQIVIKLSGNYFQLRDYLSQLEAMKWKFFWQDFNYQLKQYPTSELEVRLYSLSTKREFIGV